MGQIKNLSQKIHENAISKGWYENGNNTNIGEKIALIHSELSEALEADRKNKHAPKQFNPNLLKDSEFKIWFENYIKDTFEDEIADTVIRCFDMAIYVGFDLENHILAKMRYNTLRPVKHGGKKY